MNIFKKKKVFCKDEKKFWLGPKTVNDLRHPLSFSLSTYATQWLAVSASVCDDARNSPEPNQIYSKFLFPRLRVSPTKTVHATRSIPSFLNMTVFYAIAPSSFVRVCCFHHQGDGAISQRTTTFTLAAFRLKILSSVSD